ncbi:UvrD-helicase domain-containing protein [Minwuia thermotolerans]|uniref:DNA 3'-5' helicase n=1 Tax=Minwuia thermotolerans TaxID=2056226 RepID=A0A2M9FY17_9PROT|nr:ATP-dependent helicase [Minwuia thermotolerans]PJK28358.1 ATP-dependent helicase [Minwuia thermotolerans]
MPTDQQRDVIGHQGSAFVTACPGAGKTRTMVERARRLTDSPEDRRGVAFLSFTNAAIDELEERLRAFGSLPSPLFPSFIGTFDRFLWQFLIAPFGIPGSTATPRLVPDKDDWEVKPYGKAQSLHLKCFDRATGSVVAAFAKGEGFDVSARDISPYETRARNIISVARAIGHVDFEDVRICVREHLADPAFSARVGAALGARFREIVVDEAQDCNPADLAIVSWLRKSSIVVKVICDPHQSIYKFRGGVTDELLRFADTFVAEDRLPMSGNFRSTPAICAAIAALRPPGARTEPDKPLGRYKEDRTPVHLLSYSGSGVSARIGPKFSELVRPFGIPFDQTPVLASTRASAAKAIGQPTLKATTHKTLLLAQVAMNYHFAFAAGNRREALIALHRITLVVQGHINSAGDYHTYIADNGLEDGRWRPAIIAVANGLRFDPADAPDQWLAKARALVGRDVVKGLNINQRLKSHGDLAAALSGAPPEASPPRTIHSAKGAEFPAVCVVMTSQTAGKIMDYLEGRTTNSADEDARKIYVAASRAERLLALAVPRSSASRMRALLAGTGCKVQLHEI